MTAEIFVLESYATQQLLLLPMLYCILTVLEIDTIQYSVQYIGTYYDTVLVREEYTSSSVFTVYIVMVLLSSEVQ